VNTNAQQVTVVGYDGSDSAKAALQCATRRASPGGRVVVAHAAAAPTELLGSAYYEDVVEQARERAGTVLEDVATGPEADVEIETALLSGPPARSLVRLARETGASEIAVGSRGFGRFRAAALGSTSHALLHEADRPVLLVTRRAVEREIGRPPNTGGNGTKTIVTGYDGSENGRAALNYAVERLATGRDGHIVATYAYDAPSDWLGTPYYQRTLDENQQRGRQLLRDLEQEGLAAGELETELIQGPPAGALVRVAHAHHADEIVVGSRGLGLFRAALGSVSHELLHEADLPIVVVPGESRG
jgi:nucleotide-binding universal stress UspA family protein